MKSTRARARRGGGGVHFGIEKARLFCMSHQDHRQTAIVKLDSPPKLLLMLKTKVTTGTRTTDAQAHGRIKLDLSNRLKVQVISRSFSITVAESLGTCERVCAVKEGERGGGWWGWRTGVAVANVGLLEQAIQNEFVVIGGIVRQFLCLLRSRIKILLRPRSRELTPAAPCSAAQCPTMRHRCNEAV